MIWSLTLSPGFDVYARIVPGNPNAVEEPGSVAGWMEVPSGKGINASRVINALGGNVACITTVSRDEEKRFRTALEPEVSELVTVACDGALRRNLTIVKNDGSPAQHYRAENHLHVKAKHVDSIIARLQNSVREDDVVCLHGSIPTGITADVYARIANALQKNGCRLLVDASGDALREALRSKLFFACKPNVEELSSLMGRRLASTDLVAEALHSISENVRFPLATLGSAGVCGIIYERTLHLKPTLVEPAVRFVGAGDVFMGAFAFGLQSNLSHNDLLDFGQAASVAHVCGRSTFDWAGRKWHLPILEV